MSKWRSDTATPSVRCASGSVSSSPVATGSAGNVTATGPGTRFSLKWRPGGEGCCQLKRGLREVHGFSSNEFVLAIDCSGSFLNSLPGLERGIMSLAKSAAAVFCFAGSAKEISPDSLDLAVIRGQSESLSGGTLLGPLVSGLESLPALDSSHTDLILVTDGEVSDSSNELRTRLEKMFSNVEQVADEDTLSRVVAERYRV